MPRVLITPTQMQGDDSLCATLFANAGCEVVYPPEGQWMPGADALVELLRDVDAVVASSERYTREVLERSQLRVVSRAGVGYDAIDVQAATDFGIAVCITSGAVTESAAEHALALILAVLRGIVARDGEVRRGQWLRTPLPRLAGQTLGIVGLGAIGKSVVARAKGFGVNIVAYDPVWDEAFAAAHQIRRVEFTDLLAEADIVSLHAPATDSTAGMINADALGRVRPGTVLINTARGSLVDEQAVADALHSGRLGAAGLDVFATEPAPLDSPLLDAPNTVLTTHMGGLDEQSAETMARVSARNVIDLAQGRWPAENIVNKDLAPDWRW
jgi:D-3-phosphoglycerate dehydrogenase